MCDSTEKNRSLSLKNKFPFKVFKYLQQIYHRYRIDIFCLVFKYPLLSVRTLESSTKFTKAKKDFHSS